MSRKQQYQIQEEAASIHRRKVNTSVYAPPSSCHITPLPKYRNPCDRSLDRADHVPRMDRMIQPRPVSG